MLTHYFSWKTGNVWARYGSISYFEENLIRWLSSDEEYEQKYIFDQ